MKTDTLQLSDLQKGMPGITTVEGAFLQENAMVALHKANHHSPTKITLTGVANRDIQLSWDDSVDQQMLNSYNDEQENVEFAAMGISALLTPYLTDYTVVMRSRKGTGFDFWLGQKNAPWTMLAVLEVSGIASENPNNTMTKRIAAKREQIKASDSIGLPQYISVVEMATPKVHYELFNLPNHE